MCRGLQEGQGVTGGVSAAGRRAAGDVRHLAGTMRSGLHPRAGLTCCIAARSAVTSVVAP